jgi:hypothetical protein
MRLATNKNKIITYNFGDFFTKRSLKKKKVKRNRSLIAPDFGGSGEICSETF